jgi:hypothetical protein
MLTLTLLYAWVCAQDKFGNGIGSHTNGEVADVNLEIKGPARFQSNGKLELKKLSLSDGGASFVVVWHEAEKPRPVDAAGIGQIEVKLHRASGVDALVSTWHAGACCARGTAMERRRPRQA